MRFKLHNLIFVGMALGVIVGLSLFYLHAHASQTDLSIDVVFGAEEPLTGELRLLSGQRTLDLNGRKPGATLPIALQAGDDEQTAAATIRPGGGPQKNSEGNRGPRFDYARRGE